jgi:hypothetical protein
VKLSRTIGAMVGAPGGVCVPRGSGSIRVLGNGAVIR